MNYQQARQHWNQGSMLIMVACLCITQSCSGNNKVATECFHLQEAINTHQPSFPSGSINKASETAKARAEKDFAEALTAVALSDETLKEKRDRIVGFSRQSHTLSLQAADIMTEDGRLSGNAANQYETLLTQRIAINDQLVAEQNGLQIHCSLQS